LINTFLPGLLILTLGFSSPEIAEDSLKVRITKHIRKVTIEAKIQEPFPDITTSLPSGPGQYPRVVDGVVYIVTGEGITGSGTVISRSFGLIITNWHVVGNEHIVGVVFKPPAPLAKFSFRTDNIFFARVLKTDSIRDLALLEMVSPPRRMIAIPLGSGSPVEVGHDVFSVSHPKGSLWSYAKGVISEIRPKYGWVSDDGAIHRDTLIQTLTVTGQGIGEGPLFDKNGRFIGVLVGTSGEELNFAIAIDEVREFVFSFLDQLRNSSREPSRTKERRDPLSGNEAGTRDGGLGKDK